MNNFQFHRPSTVAEAVAALEKAAEGKLLAGGQSLLPVMKLDMAAPSDLISLGGIAELKEISVAGDVLVVGAGSTHAEVAASKDVKAAIPALAALAEHIGDPQVRNRGTIGGSLAHADPAADYPAAVVALEATIVTSKREIAADDFFTGLFETCLDEAEIITSVRFPKPDRAAYAKFPNPASKYPIAGVMVAQRGGAVRVAVTGAGPTVFRVAEMEEALARSFKPDAIASVVVPRDGLNDDGDASAEYRAHLITVMARRAVAAAS